jgi:predicted ester cyclase
MSIEENKELVRRIYDKGYWKDLAKYPDFLAPGYVEHYSGRTMSLEEVKGFNPLFSAAFPDIVSTIEDMVAEGDKVAIRVTWRGTHKGEFMGIPPKGNKIEMTNTAIFRIAEGKLAEDWATVDELRFMQQIGAIPTPKK